MAGGRWQELLPFSFRTANCIRRSILSSFQWCTNLRGPWPPALFRTAPCSPVFFFFKKKETRVCPISLLSLSTQMFIIGITFTVPAHTLGCFVHASATSFCSVYLCDHCFFHRRIFPPPTAPYVVFPTLLGLMLEANIPRNLSCVSTCTVDRSTVASALGSPWSSVSSSCILV